jgi:N-acetylglucosaminyldiphosphoundecaprenol N-acetyl-beta-D-mannosaminyltransferase
VLETADLPVLAPGGGILGAQVSETELLGFRLLSGERKAVLEHLWERYQSGVSTHILTLNPEMVMLARSNPHVAALLKQADAAVVDGVGLEWAAKMLHRRGVERYPGIELVHDLLAKAAAAGRAIYLLGAAPGVAAEAGRRLATELPGLRIAGARDGYFKQEEENEIVQEIGSSGSTLLLVGMGCPRQEEFIVRRRDELNTPLMVGVGGSFDVFSGNVRRAPAWAKRSGLEWAYRTTQDISRLKRIGVLPRFVLHVLGTAWRGGRKQAA